MRDGVLVAALAILTLFGSIAWAETGSMKMEATAGAKWTFGGEMGRRISANVENWLLRAPDANPGLIEMFRRRDRHLPYNEPVPWYGEFAGKYLISAVQACRMSDDPRLRPHVAAFVDALIASQAENGYLGPWPENEQLLGHWDLWGHYHCMLGLLMWHDETGDADSLACAVRAADFMCAVYLDGDRRPIDAGTPQINLAVLHVLGDLYRRTESPRYRHLMARIEEDMQKDGDWLRLGAEGVPYYKLPGGGTRWESLHIVQGLVELHRITGEDRYRQAVLNLWESIRDNDRHPSGAFSTHERALGSVYEQGAIETCCSVAWEALTIDVLRLTGDPRVADELELTTWNQVLAAQHPSGNWWTYDTPMNGTRAPSYHQINFQYRPGTPELNCCSVNAPRGLGMLTEWAVMGDGDGLTVNYYGPCIVETRLANGTTIKIEQVTNYPLPQDDVYSIRCNISPEQSAAFTIRFRIPAWATKARIGVNGEDPRDPATPGTYAAIHREWSSGDYVTIEFEAEPRWWYGQDDRYGQAALYVGPLLLAFDAFYNIIETADLTGLDLSSLGADTQTVKMEIFPGRFEPLGLWTVQTESGDKVTLCDFASAGAHGTDYAAWLPVADPPPPAVKLRTPKADAVGQPGDVFFSWEAAAADTVRFDVEIARDADFDDIANRIPDIEGNHIILEEPLADGIYWWRVVAQNRHGRTVNRSGARMFTVAGDSDRTFHVMRDDRLIAASALDGNGAPIFGNLSHAQNLGSVPGRNGETAVSFNGVDSELKYEIPYFPGDAYSFCAWVCPEGVPVGAIEQVFSAWCMGMDDPLRVSIRGDELRAGIEAGKAYATEPVRVTNGKWIHVAAVKQGSALTLSIDGAAVSSVEVPENVASHTEHIGLGYNPLFSGGEHFHGKIDDFAFYGRALTANEIESIAKERSE